jgi:hypothetical protein
MLKSQISMKIHPVGAQLFQADRHVDGHDETKSLFTILQIHLKMSCDGKRAHRRFWSHTLQPNTHG